MRWLPWDYGIRNLGRRPVRTMLTALGLALVVFLLLLVLSFQRGLEASLAKSGDPEIMMLLNLNAAENLENSSIAEEVAVLARTEFADKLMKYGETVAVSPELTIATRVNCPGDTSTGSLGVFRGVDWARVFLVRRQVQLVEGRLPRAGELLVGNLVAAKLGLPATAVAVGQSLIMEGKPWLIAGKFTAAGSLLDAEIWCGLDDLRPAVKRPNDLSIVAMRFDPRGNLAEQNGLLDYFCRNRRADLELTGMRESEYYASLRQHYMHIRGLAWLLVALVAVAGACGAINTMYAAVAGRVREFAALQAVGFPRRAIALSLVQESVVLAAAATLIAAGAAMLLLDGSAVRFTMGAFALTLDRPTLATGCGAGMLLGLVGAAIPAIRALRMDIVTALKAI